MLQFFKKTGRTNNEEKLPEKEKQCMSSSTSSLLPNDTNVSSESEFNDSRSRLSRNLLEIISDQNCICYFVQFLESKNALSLIKFYLDAENFKTVAENLLLNMSAEYSNEEKIKNNSESLSNSDLEDHCDKKVKVLSSSQGENISISNKNLNLTSSNNIKSVRNNYLKNNLKSNEDNDCVPELKNLCDLSMRKPLTDDEKSRIYAETNKIKNTSSLKLNDQENNLSSENHFLKFNSSIAADAFRIYKKYLTSNSSYFIDIPAIIISNISLAICSPYQINNEIDTESNSEYDDDDGFSKKISQKQLVPSNCFEEAKLYVFNRMEKEYLNEFLESSFYCKYCLDILTSLDLQLSDILFNESALFYFMEYLEQENHRNYLEFWMAAINFRRHYQSNINSKDNKKINEITIKEAKCDAMILYEKYFSLQTDSRLQIFDNLRSKIEENICSDNPEKIWQCFDFPLKVIEKDFECNYFKSFLKSQLFTNYLNELRSKLKDYVPVPKTNTLRRKLSSSQKKQSSGHRKTMSDCTNENTKVLRNTLLAMESNSSKLKNIHNRCSKTKITSINTVNSGVCLTPDMQIETKNLTNPDLLWHRKSSPGGLKFGRVDEFGRYERDFEMETIEDKWSFSAGSNKIKNAVRKLVNLPEEKVQEEIAWQVAELIVKDITSITLGNNTNKNENQDSNDG